MPANRRQGLLAAKGWKVGSFRGVDIRLHITLLIILPYIVWITAARFDLFARSAGIAPESLALRPAVWGVLLAVLLFSSVLIHEMGHVWVALRQGARVRSITLMMLGGISDIEEIPHEGRQEFRLAIIGPMVSLGLSGLGFATARLATEPNIDFVALWFGQVNLVLAIFNLMPAFPLDGGRAFRSLLSARMGHLRATQIATRVSTGFAWAFGLLGILGFNIFLILIAFFLYAAAQSELTMTLARGLLHGLSVGDVATPSTPLDGGSSLIQATERMLASRQTLVPIQAGARGAGLLSLAQIRNVPGGQRGSIPVNELQQAFGLRTLEVTEPLEDVLAELSTSPLAALPVSKDGVVIGYIRYADLADVLQLRSLEKPEEMEAA